MKVWSVPILIMSTAGSIFLYNLPSKGQSVNFICAVDNSDIPTTYAETPDGSVEVFKWKSTYFNPPYTPMQRCLEVSERMNTLRPNILVTGQINNYNVICAGQSCDPNGSNILLTLRPNQNPEQILYEIDQTRDAAGGPSMQLTGGSNSSSQGKNTNLTRTSEGSLFLNLDQHIQTAPKIPRRFSGQSNSTNSTPNLTPNPPSNSGSSPGKIW